MKTVDICYKTGWPGAIFHGAVDGQSTWQSHEFREFPLVEYSAWRTVRVRANERIEFVCCNKEKTDWDKERSEGYGKNYVIDLKNAGVTSQPKGYAPLVEGGDTVDLVYVLRHGKISLIEGSPILLVADVDGTIVGDDEELSNFRDHWETKQLFRGSKLVFNSGRNLKDFLQVARQCDLPRPTMAVLGAGTEVYDFPMSDNQENSHLYLLPDNKLHDKRISERQNFNEEDRLLGRDELIKRDTAFDYPAWCPSRRHARINKEWFKKLNNSWDRDNAIKLAVQELPRSWINGTPAYDPLRVSVSVEYDHLLEVFGDKLDPTKNGNYHMLLAQNVIKAFPYYRLLISGKGQWRYLDILPMSGGKDAGSLIVAEELGFKKDSIVMAGDSGNDVGLFAMGTKSICVGNADHDLIEFLKFKVPPIPIDAEQEGEYETDIMDKAHAGTCLGHTFSSLDPEKTTDGHDSEDLFDDSEDEYVYRANKKKKAKRTTGPYDNNQQGKVPIPQIKQKSSSTKKAAISPPNLIAAFAYLQGTTATSAVYFANRIVAGGVLEGLEHFKFA